MAGMASAATSACGQQGSQTSSAQPDAQDRISKIVASMTIEQKLAQMMIVCTITQRGLGKRH